MVLLWGAGRSSQGLWSLAASLLRTQDCLCAVSWWLPGHQLQHSYGKEYLIPASEPSTPPFSLSSLVAADRAAQAVAFPPQRGVSPDSALSLHFLFHSGLILRACSFLAQNIAQTPLFPLKPVTGISSTSISSAAGLPLTLANTVWPQARPHRPLLRREVALRA